MYKDIQFQMFNENISNVTNYQSGFLIVSMEKCKI